MIIDLIEVLRVKNHNLTAKEIQELSKRIRLRILHEDEDVILVTAPTDDELTDIVRELLKSKSMNLKEIHLILSGIASEDKIRRAINTLIDQGEVYVDDSGRYTATSIG